MWAKLVYKFHDRKAEPKTGLMIRTRPNISDRKFRRAGIDSSYIEIRATVDPSDEQE